MVGLMEVFEKLLNNNDKREGDYYDEKGFLICGVCHTPKEVPLEKQAEFLLKAGKIKRPTLCQCRLKELEQEEKLKIENQKVERINHLRETGLLDPQYLKYRIEYDDKTNPKLTKAIIRYTDKWQEMKEKNIGILFTGGVGTGKTFASGCIANILIDKGIPVLMSNIPSLVTSIAKGFEENKINILNRVANVSLLVLDDLGIERDTSYGYEKLQEIIDTRYRSGKPLIVTTNLSKEELKNPTDLRYKRVYDRILEMCVTIPVTGESRRKEKAQQKMQAFKDLILE